MPKTKKIQHIKELVRYENQFPNFGELMISILLKPKVDQDFIIQRLLNLLSRNPKLQILSIRTISDCKPDDVYRFMMEIKFTCCHCKSEVIEETNLLTGERGEMQWYCDGCRDQMQEYAMDAAYEEEQIKKQDEEDKINMQEPH